MAEFCLTTITVPTGEGTIVSPACTTPLSNCAGNVEEGADVVLYAYPPDESWNGSIWYFGGWTYAFPNSSSRVLSWTTTSSGTPMASFVMPNEDLTIYATFYRKKVTIHASASDGGCIDIFSPSSLSGVLSCQGGIIEIDPNINPSIVFQAIPDSAYSVEGWYLDGSLVSLEMSYTLEPTETEHYLSVVFEPSSGCSKNTLTINIEGIGATNFPSGEYCDFQVLTLLPIEIPGSGYVFDRWSYGDGFTLLDDNRSLVVEMGENRVCTAYFIQSGEIAEYDNYQTFYCSSYTDLSNVIAFNFNPSTDPSFNGGYHFKLTFYSDSYKQNQIFTAFSLSDNKRWYYEDEFIKEVPSGGVGADIEGIVKVVYDPDILPSSMWGTQISYYTDGVSNEEIPLLCGVKYYVDIESYDGNSLSFVEGKSIIFPCGEENEEDVYFNVDKNKWISSGNGKDDLKVSEGESFAPSVCSNGFGQYVVAWHSKEFGVYNVYGGIWDSNTDILFSSGQGNSDMKLVQGGRNPIVMVDQADNFPVVANSDSQLKFYNCPFPRRISDSGAPDVEESEIPCYPLSSSNINSGFDSIVARVLEEDQKGSIVVNSSKVLSVVDNQIVRIEVDGVKSAYAVRVREDNGESLEWDSWLNIEQNTVGDVYRVDDSRFVVTKNISRGNGIRRICLQILTLYGITDVVCVEFYLSKEIISYKFEFYTDAQFLNECEIYNGYYVIPSTSESSDYIYFKAIFNEDVAYTPGDLSYNLFQQGINDLWGQSFDSTKLDSRTFTGKFKVNKDDNVFNKDGKAFIQVVFPDDESSSCVSNTSDKYNLMLNFSKYQEYQDETPENIYNRVKTTQAGVLLNGITFKQYYNSDDANFRFGNPDYFRND